MAGVIRRCVRAVAVPLLLVAAVSAPVVTHLLWVSTAERVYEDSVSRENKQTGTTQDDKERERARAAAEKKYRAKGRPWRTGSTNLKVTPKPASAAYGWQVTAKHTLELRSADPLVEDLRVDSQDLDEWLPFELTAGAKDCWDGLFTSLDGDDRLDQESPESKVRAIDYSSVNWYEDPDCNHGRTAITLHVDGHWLGERGLYDRWTFTVEAPEDTILAIKGATTLRQSAHRAELLLPAKTATVLITLVGPDSGPSGDRTAKEVLTDALEGQQSAQHEALWLLLAVTSVMGYLVVPHVRSWAPSATRLRWNVATVAGGVLTGATLVYALSGTYASLWPWWVYGGRGVFLAVWWWTLLPFLLAAIVVRAATGRAPRVRELLPSLVPSVLLLAPVGVLIVTGRTPMPLVMVAVTALATASVAYALWRGALGPAGRRWAVVAAACVWLTGLVAGPGTGLPAVDSPHFDTWNAANICALVVLFWSWVALLWHTLRAADWVEWQLRALAVAMGLAILRMAFDQSWVYTWARDAGGPWTAVGVFPRFAANWPLSTILPLGLPVALILLHSYRGTDGRWPPYVRTIVLGLGVAAVGTGLDQFQFVMFEEDAQRSGFYIAVAIAAMGFAWLLPPAAESRAVRLHNKSPAAHNRRMHALLKDQTLAASRREFLTASRTALAEGQLSARQWSARWRALRALGPRGKAPQRSVALRLSALGTSGGRAAWSNGTAAALLLTVLSLPWIVYTLPSLLAATQAASEIDEWLHVLHWWFYGFVYGYAYSWLRGGTPIGKAMCLLAVVLPSELAQLLYRDRDLGSLGVSALLTTGNCLAVFLILGLACEARLVRAAGLRWGQIRNFRSLSATAVPATTVLVAAATALATAMVGVWVAPDNGPASETPENRPSVSGSPTPGP
ncbi:hypothetical protein [Streptomyces sp. NBC_01615]|uniref:hypothetical protein n=1 Tax=Streptomyces sp. NBC_01615 TaxID=2975898 RepID=UPI00386C1345